MATGDQLESIARDLNERYKDRKCVVKLKRGDDHLAQARMEVEQVYYDDDPHVYSRTLRVVGRETMGSEDHAMVACPIDDAPDVHQRRHDDGAIVVNAGDWSLWIVPND